MKILVVDDELVSREKMKRIMSVLGGCDEAVSGQEAIEAFGKASEAGQRYDLITLDISMPDMDGTEVLNHIRSLENQGGITRDDQVKIFMVTASSEKDIIMTCIKSGCNDYIMKPFSLETVTKKLKDNGLVQDIAQNGSPANGNGAQEKKNPLTKIIAQFNRGEIELPPMPRVQSKFLELIKAGSTLKDIGELLKQDPAVSSKLISISNSSYYRGISENVTVEQAVNRLGLLTTKQTVDALANRSLYLGSNPRFSDVMERLWEHALACGHACQVITEVKGIKLSEDPFTMGLLHDIGKLMLLRVIGEIDRKDKEQKEVSPDELMESIGAHHGKAGTVLMKKWGFPPVFLSVTELHDRMDQIAEPSRELLVVHLANVLVKSMGYGTPNPDGLTPEALPALTALEIDPAQLETIRDTVSGRMEELKNYLA